MLMINELYMAVPISPQRPLLHKGEDNVITVEK